MFYNTSALPQDLTEVVQGWRDRGDRVQQVSAARYGHMVPSLTQGILKGHVPFLDH